MIIQENIGNDLVKTYSDQGMMIRGGVPEGLYDIAIDPKRLGRTYVETDIPIPTEEEPEEGDEDYLEPEPEPEPEPTPKKVRAARLGTVQANEQVLVVEK